MGNIYEYKGYYTKIEYSVEDKVLFGKIEGINDLVNFESAFAEEIEKEFHLAVDDYLEYCAELGKEPNKTYSGTFNIRIKPSLHKALAIKANKEDISLNKAVEQAINNYVNNENIFNEAVNNIWKSQQVLSGLVFTGIAASSVTNKSMWVGDVANV